MNTFWITAGNTEFDRRRMGLAKLPYPLAYYSPATAFALERSELVIMPERKQAEIGIELAVKTSRKYFQNEIPDIQPRHLGWQLCLSLTSYRHLDNFSVPTPRDRGVCEYYSRWDDGANMMLELPDTDWKELAGTEIIIEPKGFPPITVKNTVLHGPEKVITFLASFTILPADTHICLGPVTRVPTKDVTALTLTVPVLNYRREFSVTKSLAGQFSGPRP